MTKRTFLITGGAGFVGHHVVEHILKNYEDDAIIVVDSLTYSGSLDRLRDINLSDSGVSALDDPRVKVFTWDFRNPAEPNLVRELEEVTHVLHLGAESHVDNSVLDPLRFVESNIVGTVNMLNLARQLPRLDLFVYFSTDEIYGPAPLDFDFKGFKERERYLPSNPYSGTKAAGEMMVISFANTYSIPCIITNGMNIFGQRQHPEKFIPMCIREAVNGGHIQIHSAPDKKQAGMRTYIHARNVSAALFNVIESKHYEQFPVTNVESYNIVGEEEVDNLTLFNLINKYTKEISKKYGIESKGATYEMIDFHSARPHHDVRYRICGDKMKELGWVPPKTFEESLRENIEWYFKEGNFEKWLNIK